MIVRVRRQVEFTKMVPRLIDKAFEMGYLVTLGDAYRDPRAPYGSKSSRHRVRLAIDLNLFKDHAQSPNKGLADMGIEYLKTTEDHRELGEWWESKGGIWGGRFNDGNHYEWPLG